MMCGLQGAGKTTHCAKLARGFQAERQAAAATSTVRRRSNKLQIVGEQAGVPVFEMGQGDPVEIARKAVLHARDYGNAYRILDMPAVCTSTKGQLMDELRRIKETVQPQEILLVIDAMTGQDAAHVAKSFDETLEH